jgi:hypothetical protein
MRIRKKVHHWLTNILWIFIAIFIQDNVPSLSMAKNRDNLLRLWNFISPALTHIFFTSCIVLGFFGMQYVLIHSRNFFSQLGFALVILLALLFIHSLANSKNPQQQMKAFALSMIVMFMIGIHANRFKLQEAKAE